jgi:glycosyltransferase involved in cell wall biosynthesis
VSPQKQLISPRSSVSGHVHNRCRLTFCPSASTAEALTDKGFANLQVWSRGVDTSLFRPTARSVSLRFSWGVDATALDSEKVVLLYVGRISCAYVCLVIFERTLT